MNSERSEVCQDDLDEAGLAVVRDRGDRGYSEKSFDGIFIVQCYRVLIPKKESRHRH